MDRVVEHAVAFAAEPDRLWWALTDPDGLAGWFPDRADVDVRPGGEGRFIWIDHGGKAVTFDEVERNVRLVWRWALSSETPVGAGVTTRVEWTIEPREDGGAILRIRETDFETDEHYESNIAGWRAELEELIEFLGEGEFV